MRTKLEAIHRACEGTKLLQRKAETVTNSQDTEKKPFKPAGPSQPEKDMKSWGKRREYSKKFCKCCNEHGGAETTHDTKDYKKYNTKGDRMVSFGRPNKNRGDRRNVRIFLIRNCLRSLWVRKWQRFPFRPESVSTITVDTMGMMSWKLTIPLPYRIVS